MKLTYNNIKIIILATEGESTTILYNSLKDIYSINNVIIEKSVKPFIFLKNRYKKVGLIKFIDQILFLFFLNKILTIISKERKFSILHEKKLSNNTIDEKKITRISSANSIESINLINQLAPNIVIVNGTRILSKKLLSSTNAIFINIHAGITPSYRGVHGAYWAYTNKQSELAGVTLHYVDSGVDTGKIIGQAIIKIEDSDNFTTYPLIQLSEGIVLLKKFLDNIIKCQKIETVDFKQETISKQWYHPGFFEYIYNRFFNNVK